MAPPNILSYLDYRVYLRAWLAAKKAQRSSYSMATFAKAGGCSKAALANVLSGARNPRPTTLDAFAQAMSLSPNERNYFGLLVELEASASLEARREVMQRILESERFEQVRIADKHPECDIERYTEHWYVPIIRELAFHPSFRADPVWIAETVTPTLTEEEAAGALQTLVDLEMISIGEDGQVVVHELRIRTEPDAVQRAVTRYYQEQIPVFLQHLDVSRSDEQHTMAMVLRLPLEMLPEAKARIQALVEQMSNLADDPKLGGDQAVYQFAVQLLPATKRLSLDH